MKTYNFIYKITNRINGKIYIGKHSTNRLNDGYMGSGVIIKQAIKKYGVSNFSKFILCFCHDEESLNRAEINYISAYDSLNKNVGYNLTYGGDGVIPTDETRKIMSEVHKGKNHTEETRMRMSEVRKGKHHSEEHRRKLGEAHKGNKNWNYLIFYGFSKSHAQPSEESYTSHTFNHNHHTCNENDCSPVNTAGTFRTFSRVIPETQCKNTFNIQSFHGCFPGMHSNTKNQN